LKSIGTEPRKAPLLKVISAEAATAVHQHQSLVRAEAAKRRRAGAGD
jgi:hypothetical protein